MKARFPIHAQLDKAKPSDGTVEINRETGVFTVRPKYSSRLYSLPLATVASIVVSRLIKEEVKK